MSLTDYTRLRQQIHRWAQQLGFSSIRISDLDVTQDKRYYQEWLAKQFHGEMHYLAKNTTLRYQPDQLVSNVKRVIVCSMDYLQDKKTLTELNQKPNHAVIAHYALGRDYHKLIRKRLTHLAKKINKAVGEHGYRAFCDSAPVLERAYGAQSGLGWIGKNTMLMNREQGSWFFLGELYTTLPLPVDQPISSHCGSCTACIDICPPQAIVAPYQLDARRCISYLTIEQKGAIPKALRPLMGNRIFGCDDCQLVCPWNRFAKLTQHPDFLPRHGLDDAQLIDLFLWTEDEFNRKTEGSAIRRTGYLGWLRNIAVALGNAPTSPLVITALQSRQQHPNALLREHIEWALEQHTPPSNMAIESKN